MFRVSEGKKWRDDIEKNNDTDFLVAAIPG